MSHINSKLCVHPGIFSCKGCEDWIAHIQRTSINNYLSCEAHSVHPDFWSSGFSGNSNHVLMFVYLFLADNQDNSWSTQKVSNIKLMLQV